jgi:AcrR family transcriptional regulator
MSPRTPEQNEEIRRQTQTAIQEAAFELFAQKGYSHTSISAIAKKAGVSKGLIYHYFSSKEEILEFIFRHWVEATEYMLHTTLDITPAERMRRMLSDVFDFIEHRPDISRLMTSLALQPDAIAAAKPYLDEVKTKQIDVIVSLLRELNYSNPEEEAYYLGAKLDGIALGYVTLQEEYPLQQMKQKLLQEYVPSENHD